MISFNRLGNLGRLGNQMFQYAAIKGIASYHGHEWCIPPKEAFGQEDKKVLADIDNTIYDVFKLGDHNQGFCRNSIVQESTHAFDSNLFQNCPDNVDFLGYFQTHKYFENIQDEIRKDFTFSDHIVESCEGIIDNPECVSVHIRRGDYVNLQDHHPLQTVDYYEKALHYFPHTPMIVFSDDPEWCKEQSIFQSDDVLISEGNSTGIDLYLMTKCNYHIIANSSFSWWGAFLANSRQVVAPKNWFGPLQDVDTSDKYLNNWVHI
jgi:hypothetical protein